MGGCPLNGCIIFNASTLRIITYLARVMSNEKFPCLSNLSFKKIVFISSISRKFYYLSLLVSYSVLSNFFYLRKYRCDRMLFLSTCQHDYFSSTKLLLLTLSLVLLRLRNFVYLSKKLNKNSAEIYIFLFQTRKVAPKEGCANCSW